MVEVIVIAEGQTEEQFIKRLVAPALRDLDIFVKAQILHTSRDARGGALNFDRLKFNIRNTLRQNSKAVVSTMLDLYGLDTSYPSYGQAKRMTNLRTRLLHLQTALHNAIVEETGCRPERFIPHVQPYEFEALLFSNPRVLVQIEAGWGKSLPRYAVDKTTTPVLP